jgi:hypothetical protein
MLCFAWCNWELEEDGNHNSKQQKSLSEAVNPIHRLRGLVVQGNQDLPACPQNLIVQDR